MLSYQINLRLSRIVIQYHTGQHNFDYDDYYLVMPFEMHM
jgi:hypothetical protein